MVFAVFTLFFPREYATLFSAVLGHDYKKVLPNQYQSQDHPTVWTMFTILFSSCHIVCFMIHC